MGFRFRRTIKIAPGLRLNLSRKGVSTSVGPRGLSQTFGHGKRTTTVGLPGTGLSHTSVESTRSSGGGGAVLLIVAAIIAAWLIL